MVATLLLLPCCEAAEGNQNRVSIVLPSDKEFQPSRIHLPPWERAEGAAMISRQGTIVWRPSPAHPTHSILYLSSKVGDSESLGFWSC